MSKMVFENEFVPDEKQAIKSILDYQITIKDLKPEETHYMALGMNYSVAGFDRGQQLRLPVHFVDELIYTHVYTHIMRHRCGRCPHYAQHFVYTHVSHLCEYQVDIGDRHLFVDQMRVPSQLDERMACSEKNAHKLPLHR